MLIIFQTRTAGAICVLPTTPLSLLQQVEISPSEINFGTLQEGGKYHVSLTLKNVGVHPCRFRIRQPHPATGLKVRYSPGQVCSENSTRSLDSVLENTHLSLITIT